jgi:hypothetical protein
MLRIFVTHQGSDFPAPRIGAGWNTGIFNNLRPTEIGGVAMAKKSFGTHYYLPHDQERDECNEANKIGKHHRH